MQKEYWFVIISGILSGLIVFGGGIFTGMGLSAYEISVLPAIFSVIILLPFVLKNERKMTKGKIKIIILYGFISAGAILCQYVPLVLGVPVAVVVLLLYTQPFWTIIFSKILLKEKITKLKIMSMMTILVGLLFIVNPFQIERIGSIIGVTIALVCGVLLSAWIITGRIAGKMKINPITTKFGYMLFTIIFMIISYPLVKNFIKEPSITSLSFNQPLKIWFYLLVFEVFASIINHLFYLKGVEKVSASDAGIILLLEPVVGTILAAIFLGQLITWNIIVGGLLILVSNYIVIREED